MPIKLASEPPEGLGVVSKAIDELQNTAAQSASVGSSVNGPWQLLAASRSSLTATVPHPVYDLRLDDVAADKGIDAAELVGWRYLLEDNGRTVALADVSSPTTGSPVEFTAFNTGRFAAATRDGLEAAEHLDFVKNGDFEFRVLRIPALYVIAIWLRATSGDDAIIPLAPAPDPLVAGSVYGEADFLSGLRQLAVDRASFQE